LTSTTVGALGLGPLHAAQMRFMLAPQPNRLYLGGIGSGKTAVGLLACVTEALRPENRGLPIGVFAPTFRQSKRIHVARILAMLDHWERAKGWSLVRRFHRSDFILELRGGAELWFLSFAKDVDRLRGIELAGAYVDEIEQVPDPAAIWALISGRVRIGSSRKWATTTPKGYRGVPRLFVEALQGGSKIHHLVKSTSMDNPYLDAEVVADWKANLSRRSWRSEVECSLLRSPDVVFPEFVKKRWPDGHLIDHRHQYGDPWFLSCDWGYSHASFLAWQRIERDGTEIDVCFLEEHPDDTPMDRQRGMIRDMAKKLGREPLACYTDRADPRQNRWLMNEFRSAQIITMQSRAQQSQWGGMETIRALLDPMGDAQADELNPPKLAFSTGLLHCDGDRGIVRSFEMLRRRTVNNELVDEVLKDNVFDHAIDSCAYMAKGRHGMIGAFTM